MDSSLDTDDNHDHLETGYEGDTNEDVREEKVVQRSLADISLSELIENENDEPQKRAYVLRLRGNKILIEGNDQDPEKVLPEALFCFTKSIELNPTAEVYANRSLVYVYLQQFEDALVDADMAIKLKSDWPRGYYRKGKALHFLKRWDESLKVWTTAVERWPENESLKHGKEQMMTARMAEAGIREIKPNNLFSSDHWLKLKNHPKTAPFMEDPQFVRKLQIYQENPGIIKLKDFQGDQRIMTAMNVLMGLEEEVPQGMTPQQYYRKKQKEERKMAELMELEYQRKKFAERKADKLRLRAEKEAKSETSVGDGGDEDLEKAKDENESSSDSEFDESKFIVRDEWTDSDSEEKDKNKEAKIEEMIEEDPEVVAKREKSLELKDAGNAAYHERRFDDALKLYQEARELDDKNLLIVLNIAAVRLENSEYEKSIELCQYVIERAKEGTALDRSGQNAVAKAYSRIGSVYMAMEKYEDAVEALSEAVYQDKTPQNTRKLQLAQKKLREQAIDESKTVVAEGDQFMRQEKYSKAIDLYTSAISKNPKNHLVYSKRSACYQKLAEYEKSLKDVAKCLELEPSFLTALVRRGEILYEAGNFQAALQAFMIAKKQYPDDPSVNRGLARVQKRMQEFEDESRKQAKIDIERKLQDPRIRAVMADPTFVNVIIQMQKSEAATSELLKNPEIREKVGILVNAGVMRMFDPETMGPIPGMRGTPWKGMPIFHPGVRDI